ncbi:HEAT repeat domain-containing protein [Streptomyces sp. NPDC007875]|uniref:HEAT repeat domain-containing protein n=1 Tax=Streptomyces sp. NPDC007875 TaxID=3364783 RepID=UPI00369672DF
MAGAGGHGGAARECSAAGDGTGGRGPGASAARSAGSAASPRILELLALAEEQPELPALQPYPADPDPAVRRAVVATLTETAPPGTGPALAAALADADSGVRADAAASLRELDEVLPPDAALREPLVHGLDVAEPVVRAAALDVLRALGLGDAELFARALTDAAIGVRIQAVRGLVSVAHSPRWSREPRTRRERCGWRRRGRWALWRPAADARRLLTPLLRDPDVLVRAAALEALAPAGCPAPLDAEVVAALGDSAWQVRKGAATALSAAAPELGVPALGRALADPHADVRKAAVLALLPLAEREVGAREAFSSVRSDPDAEVRAYAARASATA